MPKGVYERKLKPLIKAGDKFDKLTAVKFSYRNKDSYQFWLFRCDCGKEKIISINSVKRGNTKSCGCLLKKGGNLTHKMSKTRTYTSWQKMKERCLNKKCEEYKYYGKRGITICDRWLGKNGFINFYKDIGERPKEKSLDRINNNKGYCLENCRWATNIEQHNNTRYNRFLTYKGKTQTFAQWARKLGIKRYIIHSRIGLGWSIKKTLTFPVRTLKKDKQRRYNFC